MSSILALQERHHYLNIGRVDSGGEQDVILIDARQVIAVVVKSSATEQVAFLQSRLLK